MWSVDAGFAAGGGVDHGQQRGRQLTQRMPRTHVAANVRQDCMRHHETNRIRTGEAFLPQTLPDAVGQLYGLAGCIE